MPASARCSTASSTAPATRCEEAGDAFQALDRLDAQPPDAVLLDIKMPGMDGLGLLENLRQRGLEIPVVMLTGHGDQFTARAVSGRRCRRLSDQTTRPVGPASR